MTGQSTCTDKTLPSQPVEPIWACGQHCMPIYSLVRRVESSSFVLKIPTRKRFVPLEQRKELISQPALVGLGVG